MVQIFSGLSEYDVLNFSNGIQPIPIIIGKELQEINILIKKSRLLNNRFLIWRLELLMEFQDIGNSSPRYINTKAYYFNKTKRGIILRF
jgi:hypothetical protein